MKLQAGSRASIAEKAVMESSSEDLDSLFEGMVLIDHSFPSSPPPPPTPTPAAAAAAADEERPSTLAPLDENLFSDLTFFNPSSIPDDQNHQPQHDDPIVPSTPAPTTAPPLPARQPPSRKKKRAAIRIGYGRAVADPEALSPPSSPQPALPLPSPTNVNAASYSSSVEEEVVTHLSIQSDVATDSLPSPTAVDSTPTPQLQSMSEDPADSSSEKNSIVEAEDEKAVHKSAAVVAHLDDAAEKSTQEEEEEEATATEAAAAEANGSSVDEAKLDSITALIAKKLEHIQEMAATASTMRKEAARQRRKEVENVNSVSAKYKDLERRLEEACEAEDFEQAESLSESLAAAEREKEGSLNALRVAEADCDSTDTKMQEVLALQIAAEEEAVMMLNQFAKVSASSLDKLLELNQFNLIDH
ncbi:hypothetical protein ACLOJK_037721 [Asimina triloba]